MTKLNNDPLADLLEDPNAEPTTDPTPAGANIPEIDPPVDNTIPYDRFKTKVDEVNALKAQLADFEAEKAKTERKALEEQNDFKTLYEQAQVQIEANKADALKAKKDAQLIQAGYTAEQVEVLRVSIGGETDEEITKSIEAITNAIPPQQNHIDPTPLGGGDSKPTPKGNDGLGLSLYERVMGKK